MTEGLESAIVALNRLKIKKPGDELTREINELQRKLEERAGVTAVELDPAYGDGQNDEPDRIQIEKRKVSTMVHQLTVTAERGSMPMMSLEHITNARDWLVEALENQPESHD